jgi:hypothetical protein
MNKRSFARGNHRIDGEHSEAISRQRERHRQSRAEGVMSEAINGRRSPARGNQGQKEHSKKQSRAEEALPEAITVRRSPVRGNQWQKEPCQRQSRAERALSEEIKGRIALSHAINRQRERKRQSVGIWSTARGSYKQRSTVKGNGYENVVRGNQWKGGAISERLTGNQQTEGALSEAIDGQRREGASEQL